MTLHWCPICRQGRLDERGHRCSLNAFARHIAQNHDGAVVGKTDERIEIAADQRRVRGRQVHRIGCDTRNIPQGISHADLKGLSDMALLALLRFAFVDQFKVMRQVHQVVIFKIINRLLATITKQQRARRRALRNRSRTRVETFVTAFIAKIDLKAGRATYCSLAADSRYALTRDREQKVTKALLAKERSV